MAKYLDGGGLSRLWNRIKSYVTGYGYSKAAVDTSLNAKVPFKGDYYEIQFSLFGPLNITKEFGMAVVQGRGKLSGNTFVSYFELNNQTSQLINVVYIRGGYTTPSMSLVKVPGNGTTTIWGTNDPEKGAIDAARTFLVFWSTHSSYI